MGELDDTAYYNRLISCMDVGKDAMISFEEGRLSNLIHGPYIRDIISNLFHVEGLRVSDKQHVVGVGDKKEILKQRIEAALRLNDYKPIPITRLSFSATGQDFRPTGFFLAQDAGIGMDKISSDYTLVVTPGSVLDAAGKKKKHASVINGLASPSSLPEKILQKYDLFKTLSSISYKGHKQNVYTFEATTSVPSFSTVHITFNNAFKETGGHFFEGNRVKNKYIYDNWQDLSKQPTIAMYLLAKELQDTLQVAWLEYTIHENTKINKDKVALCTNDVNVWLRCMVNNVPCIRSYGAEINYYPIASTEAQKGVRQKLAMQTVYEQLEKHNKDVLQSLKDFYKLVSEEGDLTLTNAPNEHITSTQRGAIRIILSFVIRNIETRVTDILKKFPRTIEDIAEGLDYLETYKMKYPFLVNLKRREIRHLSTFRTFFPNAVDKVIFRPEIIHTKIMKRGDFSEADISLVLGDIPPVGGLLPISGGMPMSMKGGDRDSQEELDMILGKNMQYPGFFTYFILQYMPEIPYIAYAYGMALHLPLSMYTILFNSENMQTISTFFGKPDHAGVFEYYGSSDTPELRLKYDETMFSLCAIAKHAYDMADRNETSNIFDYAYDDIEWFLSTLFERLHTGDISMNIRSSSKSSSIDTNGTQSIRSNLSVMSENASPFKSRSSSMVKNGKTYHIHVKESIHGIALENYHMLYEAELSLINKYTRHMMTPMHSIRKKKKATTRVKKRATKGPTKWATKVGKTQRSYIRRTSTLRR